jgi:hypothetical protein
MSEEMPETASDVAWSARLLTMRLQGLTDFRFPFLRQLAPVLPVSVLPLPIDFRCCHGSALFHGPNGLANLSQRSPNRPPAFDPTPYTPAY